MYIDQFLSNHPQIKISKTVLMLCKVGETKMRNSIDPLHDEHHIGRLLNNLKFFLKKHKNHQKINFEILLLSICWHDVWKAKRQTLNPIKLIYYQLYEGIGSLLIFSKNSVGLLPNDIIAEVNYAIRKHSQFQLFSLTSIESKILKDIDDLDVLNPKRMRYLLSKANSVNKFTKQFGKSWLKILANKKTTNRLEFEWSRKKSQKINYFVNKIIRSF
jgi:hypothetical protein